MEVKTRPDCEGWRGEAMYALEEVLHYVRTTQRWTRPLPLIVCGLGTRNFGQTGKSTIKKIHKKYHRSLGTIAIASIAVTHLT